MIPIENKGELEPGAVRDFDILVVILFMLHLLTLKIAAIAFYRSCSYYSFKFSRIRMPYFFFSLSWL